MWWVDGGPGHSGAARESGKMHCAVGIGIVVASLGTAAADNFGNENSHRKLDMKFDDVCNGGELHVAKMLSPFGVSIVTTDPSAVT